MIEACMLVRAGKGWVFSGGRVVRMFFLASNFACRRVDAGDSVQLEIFPGRAVVFSVSVHAHARSCHREHLVGYFFLWNFSVCIKVLIKKYMTLAQFFISPPVLDPLLVPDFEPEWWRASISVGSGQPALISIWHCWFETESGSVTRHDRCWFVLTTDTDF